MEAIMAQPDAPSLTEIIQLTRSVLTTQQDDDNDDIRECGRPALSLLPHNSDMCLQLAYQKLHDVPYREVKRCWRRLYTDAALWKALAIIELRGSITQRETDAIEDGSRDGSHEQKEEDWITDVVKTLDMALILTGAPAREELVELWFSALKGALDGQKEEVHEHRSSGERPLKRRKVEQTNSHVPDIFPSFFTQPITLRLPIHRANNCSLEAFQYRYLNIERPTPVIIEGAIDYWPAINERSWKNPSYLLFHTLNGRRLVPIEIGRSYTDQGWGQKILSFGEFMSEYMFLVPETSSEAKGQSSDTRQTGYLAQHDLFAQIPSLRSDISIPDYCYSDPPPLNTVDSPSTKSVPKLEDPLLNAWFGPAGTISPLHTDPYHNILAQVVGYKYIRLYPPKEYKRLYPRKIDENGVDMSNTSSVDLDEALRHYPGLSFWKESEVEDKDEEGQSKEVEDVNREYFEEQFPCFKEAEYVEGILAPGECLYIPVGWWHYVRSLTPSFSVSFWFN